VEKLGLQDDFPKLRGQNCIAAGSGCRITISRYEGRSVFAQGSGEPPSTNHRKIKNSYKNKPRTCALSHSGHKSDMKHVPEKTDNRNRLIRTDKLGVFIFFKRNRLFFFFFGATGRNRMFLSGLSSEKTQTSLFNPKIISLLVPNTAIVQPLSAGPTKLSCTSTPSPS
jgi:hypothetical protein